MIGSSNVRVAPASVKLNHFISALHSVQACWDWYTNEIKGCKTPTDALAYSMRLADGGWACEKHLFEIFRNVCFDSRNLEDMEVPWLSY